MQNYANDIENGDNYAIGREWLEHDTGTSCSPFYGSPGFNLKIKE